MLLSLIVGSLLAAPDAGPKVLWTQPGSVIYGDGVPLAATDAEVITAEKGPRLRQRRLPSGKAGWTTRLKGCFAVTRMAVHDRLLVAFCERPDDGDEALVHALPAGLLVAVELGKGKKRWQREISAATGPFILGSEQILLVNDARLEALSRESGAVRWSHTLPAARSFVLEAAAGRLFVAAEAGSLTAFTEGGQKSWSAALPAGVPSIAANGEVVVVSVTARNDPALDDDDREYLRAFAAADGKVLWQRNDGAALCAPLRLAGEEVLVIGEAREKSPGVMRAHSLATGTPRWQTPVVSDCDGHDFWPQLAGDVALVWSALPRGEEQVAETLYELIAVELATGRRRWSYNAPDRASFALSAPLVRGEQLLYADGAKLRALALPPPPAPPPAAVTAPVPAAPPK